MKIEEQVYTYRDVKKGLYLGLDTENIGGYVNQKGIKDTFFSNPSLYDEMLPMVTFVRVDGDIWGRSMFFPSRFKIGDTIDYAQGGSSLYVNEKGRGLFLGSNLMMMPLRKFGNKYNLFAGISKMAIPIYLKLKYILFEIPCRCQIRNVKPVLQRLGLNFFLIKPLTVIINSFLRLFNHFVTYIMRFSLRRYTYRKLTFVPDWVEDVSIHDNHKYGEYHDKKWFEWVLNNNFFNDKDDVQNLYGIYMDEKPVGFVLLKERKVRLKDRGIDSIIFGSVIEWGICDESKIGEYELQKFALLLYSSKVDIAQIFSTNNIMLRKTKKFGLIKYDSASVVFKDLTKEMPKDHTEIENWRLRVGYSDVPFY